MGILSRINPYGPKKKVAYVYTPPYKVYTALLSQTGTDAPVATVLENTLGGVPVWSYNIIGIYWCTLANAFPEFKTVFTQNGYISSLEADGIFVYGERLNDNQINLVVAVNGMSENDRLIYTLIEIRVYD